LDRFAGPSGEIIGMRTFGASAREQIAKAARRGGKEA
jgi:hypothetical protein